MAHILIVDKDRNTWDYFEYALAHEHSVDTASNEKGLDSKSYKKQPDVIFLDLNTARLNILETVDKIKKDFSKASLQIMAEFNQENLNELEKTRSTGVDFEVCRKPLNMKDIQFKLKSKKFA